MGFLFQYSALFDSLSVGENVAFPLRRHSGMSGGDPEDVHERLAEVGLDKDFAKMPLDLSGGMQKEVRDWRALLR